MRLFAALCVVSMLSVCIGANPLCAQPKEVYAGCKNRLYLPLDMYDCDSVAALHARMVLSQADTAAPTYYVFPDSGAQQVTLLGYRTSYPDSVQRWSLAVREVPPPQDWMMSFHGEQANLLRFSCGDTLHWQAGVALSLHAQTPWDFLVRCPEDAQYHAASVMLFRLDNVVGTVQQIGALEGNPQQPISHVDVLLRGRQPGSYRFQVNSYYRQDWQGHYHLHTLEAPCHFEFERTD